ncbi:MAG TPA: branched-chain alpha-keto acid dehydrogenase subunit E2 [Flavobacteriales bacterium]|nr:branched-chain alpha-keto acid dehydrogenase subunit E2 [Flavobacteriales bacterium]HIN39900.1 branched-chain alpha-keto acid dehydrogenase subunit E2 [Flavobacteriales bacterium]
MANIIDIHVPDIGGTADVEVIEILVKPGDTVQEEDSLITLEGDKATMEVPSPESGIVKEIKVKIGGTVSEGDVILTMESQGSAKPVATEKKEAATEKKKPIRKEDSIEAIAPAGDVYASPGVRRLAHELGVDLRNVKGEGPKGRIIKQDVFAYVKQRLSAPSGGISVGDAPKVDFAKFGEVEIKKLGKIKKATAVNVHRSWVTIPHVTQFEEADITEMEEYRKKSKKKTEDKGFKLTPLVFIMKAVVNSLQEYPMFNSSLDETGDNLVIKKYYHIGIAVDTEDGLVVPVVNDVDKKDIFQLAEELSKISEKARTKKLTPVHMAGSCFTISSLGGIGGTAFTPIVKSPDVGILGVSRARIKPIYKEQEFVPRLMLPLSLSYDHRVIDGAYAARFIVDLASRFNDVKRLIK